jgi:hypothetical protein
MSKERNFENLYMMTLPRSGSTLIAQHIGEHDKIFHIGESMYWEMLDPENTTCSCGQTNCEFLSQVAQEIKGRHYAQPLLKIWQIIDNKYWPEKKVSADSIIQSRTGVPPESSVEYWLSLCPSALEQIIAAYRKHSPKEIYLDNTKLFHIAERLIAERDNWGIIALLRDPRGIMSSYKNTGIRKGDFRKAESVLPFCFDFLNSLAKHEESNKLKVIRYEDFCISPRETLVGLCEFEGIVFDERMLNPINSSVEARGHVLKGNRLLRSDRPIQISEDRSWQHNLTPEELNTLYDNEALLNLYVKYGYNF